MVVILSSIVALTAEGNSEAWILKTDKELVAVCYSVSISAQEYKLKKKLRKKKYSIKLINILVTYKLYFLIIILQPMLTFINTCLNLTK